jgi:hypothetical protein
VAGVDRSQFGKNKNNEHQERVENIMETSLCDSIKHFMKFGTPSASTSRLIAHFFWERKRRYSTFNRQTSARPLRIASPVAPPFGSTRALTEKPNKFPFPLVHV